MAKNDKHQHNHRTAKQTGKVSSQEGLLLKLDAWFEKHNKKLFYSLLVLSTLFSLLLFDSKVSEGGDDSSYIQRAWSLLNEGVFPYYQGPGYPIFLSVIIKFFGLNVISLKFFSIVCQLGFVWFTYKAFNKRVPETVLFALLAFISFNNFILYYSSQTFTETFFLFLQSVCFFVIFKIIDSIQKDDTWMEVLKKNYGKWIAFGIMFLLLSISKSVAIVCIVGVVLYFLLYKEYKQAFYIVVTFIVIRVLYQMIVTKLYGPSDSDQFEQILRKNLYKPEAGHEDFKGLVDRFFNNFNTYVSLHMYRLLNIRQVDTDGRQIIPALSYFSSIILLIFTIISYKKNRFVFFASVYLVVLCGGIFIGIQAANMQDRLIIIAMPLIFLVLFYGAYELSKRAKVAQTVLVLFAAFMLLVTVGKSSMTAQKNVIALKKNMGGDIYYGYTEDWVNFLKMSKYCADSLPDSTHVLSRKPNMSFIYGNGKKFEGQYWVTTVNPDSVQMEWKAKKIEYILLPSLRMNPKKNNGRIINTIHRMLGPLLKKYPQKVKLVKTIGTREKCDLYKVTL